jgi:hypothetical protein
MSMVELFTEHVNILFFTLVQNSAKRHVDKIFGNKTL